MSASDGKALTRRGWFNFGPRMTRARLAIVVVGILLPHLARIPWIASGKVDWQDAILVHDWRAVLFIGSFNALCWGSVLIASLTYRHVRSVWFPAILGLGAAGLGYGRLDLGADAQAPIGLIFIPIFALPWVAVGWLVGLVFDRLVFAKRDDVEPGADQFRLRSLLIVVAIMAVIAAMFTAQLRRQRRDMRQLIRQQVIEGRIKPEDARAILGDEVDTLAPKK